MRRFILQRRHDVSGVSGTGRVAEGVMFSDGQIALHWLGFDGSMVFHPNLGNVEYIHGHSGSTRIVFLDNDAAAERTADTGEGSA